MAGMQDILKNYQDSNNKDISKEEKNRENDNNFVSLSQMEAVKKAIAENLGSTKNSLNSAVDSTPVDLEPELALTPADFPKNGFFKTPHLDENKLKEIQSQDEIAANQLYLELLRELGNVFQSIKDQKPLDPRSLEKYIELIYDSITSGDFLLLKAIQHKRYAAWLISHSANVAILAYKIGIDLKYDREMLIKLGIAALLHDVGMLNVPNNIIFKHGQLTASEFEIIKKHPLDGYEMVKHLEQYPHIIEVILQEHEREDGSGYPQGLEGDKISDFAKIVGLADVFEAMVHGRAYREGFITYNAIQKIIEKRSKQFNPKIIRALINSIPMFPIGSLVKLSTNEIARVLSVNSVRPVRPVVEILIDSDGNKLKNPIRLDLEAEPLIYIAKPLAES
ncbi:MAG TPA: HD-GYP domain-containing protein [Candidatus Marinimicrobia bacterium]|nr:HD-GYP domain-containing protein [Candidatus Neomarinimicrobiota bacterium]HRU92211.1 HD-GYP domain-containing protein [Candidatus Neomarinimicrobiota bacterium]